MTDTVISDAAVAFQDEGLPNLSDGSSESYDSAGHLMALAQAIDSDSYVRSDSELTFTNHDSAADQVDLTGGIAYLDLDSGNSTPTINVQSSVGASGSTPAYDTALPTLPAVCVVVPDGSSDTTDLSLTGSVSNDVWLAYATDGTVTGIDTGDIWLRHGSGLSSPPHPHVKLGTVNPDDASADTLANRFSSATVEQLDIALSNTRRPLVSKDDTTVLASNYSDPETFIEENLPWFVGHSITFVIDEDKSSWDLYVPGFFRLDERTNSDLGGIGIIGQNSTDHKVNGVMASAHTGRLSLLLDHLEFTGEHPFDNESQAVTASYAAEVVLRDCTFSGSITNGVLSYGGLTTVALNGVDFGSNVIGSEAVRAKHFGQVYEQRSTSLRDQTEPAKGNVGGYAYDAELGWIHYRGADSTLTGNNSPDKNALDGFLVDTQNGVRWQNDAHNVHTTQRLFEVIDKSTDNSVFKAEGGGWGVVGSPTDLAGITGDFDGQVRLDDGTNVTNFGTACTWRNSDSKWYPHDGSSAFQ